MTVNVAQFIGGKIRFVILNALAGSAEPMTAYSVATKYALDPAATYRYLAEFASVGIVEPVKKARKQTAYKLGASGRAAIRFLNSLKQVKPIDFEQWMSAEALAERVSKSLAARLSAEELAELGKGEPLSVEQATKLLYRRRAGELEALIEAAKMGFNQSFKQVGNRRYRMIE